MTLVDSSVWIDYFRGDPTTTPLSRLLEENAVLLHPWVIGELALGPLGRRRSVVLQDLGRLPPATVVSDRDALTLVGTRQLWNRGIGWVDAHLLASALVARAALWTHDRRLALVAHDLGLERMRT